MAAADCIRVADDLGRFHLQYALLRKPVFGVHGSFLLINGKLENEITWDVHGSLVEDYAFAVECMKRGYRCDEIRGIVREQSPKTVLDFLRQRRRWLVGIRGLSRLSRWAVIWSVLWSISPFVKLAVVVNVTLGNAGSWVVALTGGAITATYFYLYVLGSIVQDLDRREDFATILKRAVLTFLLFPVSMVLEALPVFWSFCSREKAIGFQTVIK